MKTREARGFSARLFVSVACSDGRESGRKVTSARRTCTESASESADKCRRMSPQSVPGADVGRQQAGIPQETFRAVLPEVFSKKPKSIIQKGDFENTSATLFNFSCGLSFLTTGIACVLIRRTTSPLSHSPSFLSIKSCTSALISREMRRYISRSNVTVTGVLAASLAAAVSSSLSAARSLAR